MTYTWNYGDLTQYRSPTNLIYNPFTGVKPVLTPISTTPTSTYSPTPDQTGDKREQLYNELTALMTNGQYDEKLKDVEKVSEQDLEFLIDLFRNPTKFYSGYSTVLFQYEVVDQICMGLPIEVAIANARQLIQSSTHSKEGRDATGTGSTPATGSNPNPITATANKYGWVGIVVIIYIISKL